MKKEDGLSIVSLIVIIVILIVVLGFIANFIFGEGGIVEKYSQEDYEYNKHEIVELLNYKIKEKYIFDHKYATENNKDINEVYSEETIVKYLIENKYLEQLKDIENNLVQDQYYINATTLDSELEKNSIKANGSEGNGTKLFKVKKEEDKYLILFVDKYGVEEKIGELILKPEV